MNEDLFNQEEDLQQDMPKRNQGRTKIDDNRRQGSFSKRALNGKLTVIKKKCNHCGHHKAFVGNMLGHGINKCCRCKHKSD